MKRRRHAVSAAGRAGGLPSSCSPVALSHIAVFLLDRLPAGRRLWSRAFAKSFGLLWLFIQLLSDRTNDPRSASPPNAPEQGPSSEGFLLPPLWAARSLRHAWVTLLMLWQLSNAASLPPASHRRRCRRCLCHGCPIFPCPAPHSLTAAMEVPSRELFIGGSWVSASQRLPVVSPLVRQGARSIGCGASQRAAGGKALVLIPHTSFTAPLSLCNRTSKPLEASQRRGRAMSMLRWQLQRLRSGAAGAPLLGLSVPASCVPSQQRCVDSSHADVTSFAFRGLLQCAPKGSRA